MLFVTNRAARTHPGNMPTYLIRRSSGELGPLFRTAHASAGGLVGPCRSSEQPGGVDGRHHVVTRESTLHENSDKQAETRSMGGRSRLAASLDAVKIKVPRGGAAPCGAEFIGYLGCLDVKTGSDANCAEQRRALAKCMADASSKHRSRHKAPINYHLNKFVQTFKR